MGADLSPRGAAAQLFAGADRQARVLVLELGRCLGT